MLKELILDIPKNKKVKKLVSNLGANTVCIKKGDHPFKAILQFDYANSREDCELTLKNDVLYFGDSHQIRKNREALDPRKNHLTFYFPPHIKSLDSAHFNIGYSLGDLSLPTEFQYLSIQLGQAAGAIKFDVQASSQLDINIGGLGVLSGLLNLFLPSEAQENSSFYMNIRSVKNISLQGTGSDIFLTIPKPARIKTSCVGSSVTIDGKPVETYLTENGRTGPNVEISGAFVKCSLKSV